MIGEIRNQISICPSIQDKLYLLKSVGNESGFFFLNNHILFVVREDKDCFQENIETEQLVLNSNVHIEKVENTNSFASGQYSFIQYNGDSADGNIDFDNFISICTLYIKERENISLRDFFYSIIEMFQLPHEQTYKNLIGLYGELSVIKYIYANVGKNIAEMWHKKSTAKYDFSDGKRVIEVKTTTSNVLDVKIKHQQLFGREDIILAVVHLEESNAGRTLSDLIGELNSIEMFREHFQFQLTLSKELKRISAKEVVERQFNVTTVKFFRNTDIPTFEDIPANITDLSYRCFLLDVPDISVKDINI